MRFGKADNTIYAEKPASVHVILLLGLLALATFSQAQQEATIKPLAEVQHNASELVNSIGFYTNSQKEQLLDEANAVISQLDNRINVLQTQIESNWNNMSATARSEARQTMDALRAQRLEVAKWYGGLESSANAAWDHSKDGFAQAYGSLYEAWQEAEAEFVTGG